MSVEEDKQKAVERIIKGVRVFGQELSADNKKPQAEQEIRFEVWGLPLQITLGQAIEDMREGLAAYDALTKPQGGER